MNVLFLTLGRFADLNEHNIYTDLLMQLSACGCQIFLLCPLEKKEKRRPEDYREGRIRKIDVEIDDYFHVGWIKKGLTLLTLEKRYMETIQRKLRSETIDIVLYSTPPITLSRTVHYVKKRYHAKTYLLLKDIFPQNAVDIGLMRKGGVRGIPYHFFRRKEKALYKVSDRIGCMSVANQKYILAHNPEVEAGKVEIFPNSLLPIDTSVGKEKRMAVRKKYGLPVDQRIFVYGGNLGKPQGIRFFMKCLESQEANSTLFFLIIGDGTEWDALVSFADRKKLQNIKIIKRLPKQEYDLVVASCDVGLIFLDCRFTIPNFPSRLLGYMQARLPVLACTDCASDVGAVITKEKFGWWCESRDTADFQQIIQKIETADLEKMGENAWSALNRLYDVRNYVNRILELG